MAQPSVQTPAAPPLRVLAQGPDWRISDVVCRLGPQDRPFEERHARFSIAAVLSGTFDYRSPAGRALLYPGAFMLGNAGACYECGHTHGTGDRCIALQFRPDYFADIAGSGSFRFAPGMLPALRTLAAPLLRLQSALRGDALAAEEAAVGLVEAVVGSIGRANADAAPAPRDRRRVGVVLRHIEERSRESLSLDALAARAHMSKYHFLRTFRRVTGVTPHQFLIGTRLRRAASALRAGDAPVASIAFAEGFPDLSGFNAQFRTAFGVSPLAYRRAA